MAMKVFLCKLLSDILLVFTIFYRVLQFQSSNTPDHALVNVQVGVKGFTLQA